MSKIEKALRKAYDKKKKDSKNNDDSDGTHQQEIEEGFPSIDTNDDLYLSGSSDENKFIASDLDERKVIFSGLESRKITNAFRDLRTQLLQKSNNKNFTVLVSSANEGMDSSFVAINLAAAFSLDETKTSLVVDCELDNPKVHDVLGLDAELGVLDYLTDDSIDVSNVIYQVGIDRLRIIPSGKQKRQRSEYFNTVKMKLLLKSLTERYENRYIFVSGPPVTQSADTKILAEMCDYIIIVIPYGEVVNSDLQLIHDDLPKNKIVGVVFNNIPSA